jgi:hypothetical protein
VLTASLLRFMNNMHVQGFIGFRIMWSIRKFYDLCIPVFINNLFIYIAKKEDVIICFSFFFFFG